MGVCMVYFCCSVCGPCPMGVFFLVFFIYYFYESSLESVQIFLILSGRKFYIRIKSMCPAQTSAFRAEIASPCSSSSLLFSCALPIPS